MGKKRSGADAPAAPATPFHDAFATLRARLPARPAPREAGAGSEPLPPRAPGGEARPVARAVVRLERKGRGGKEVTVVEKLDLSPADLDRWLKELKRSLGCGGAVEGEALALQGDLRERAAALLERKGVRKVTRG